MSHFWFTALVGCSAVAEAVFQGKRSVIDLPIVTENTYSFIPVKVGTPAQDFRLLFDTGSATPWIYSTNCTAKSCPNASGYTRNDYDLAKSTTGKYTGDNSNIAYLGGGIGGPILSDIVELGDHKFRQTFIDANQSSWAGLNGDGFIGFAFNSIAENGSSTVMHTLMQDCLLEKPQFAIWYGKQLPGAENFTEGVFTIGGDHRKRYVVGDMAQIPIIKNNETGVEQYEVWRTNIVSVDVVTTSKKGSVKNNNVDFAGMQSATFDTGAGQILIADNAVDQLYSALGYSYQGLLDHTEYMPCSSFNSSWNVQFKFENKQTVTIYGDELAQPGFPAAPDACFPPFTGSGGSYNLIGTPLLTQMYSIFDFGSFDVASYKPVLHLGRLRKN